jgi:hypothetical protein
LLENYVSTLFFEIKKEEKKRERKKVESIKLKKKMRFYYFIVQSYLKDYFVTMNFIEEKHHKE